MYYEDSCFDNFWEDADEQCASDELRQEYENAVSDIDNLISEIEELQQLIDDKKLEIRSNKKLFF